MRILHIGKYYPPHNGGIEKTTQDIVEGLNQLGIKCDVLALSDDKEVEDYSDKSYNVFITATNLKAYSGAVSLNYIKKFKSIANDYDIIHVHFPNPIACLAILSSNTKAKIVIHWHSDIMNKPLLYFFYKPLEKKALKKATRIIVTSANYLKFSNVLKCYKDKCLILPSCCEPVPSKDNLFLRQKYGLSNELKIIFSLGRLVTYKGFEYLIESGKYLNGKYRIYIGGDGPLMDDLQMKIRKLKLEDQVILLGKLTDEEVSDYYNLCDIFCLPSIKKSEAFGLVQCEAFSIGKPVISTSIVGSGVSWVNQNNVTGKVVSPMDAQAIANAIIEICSDNTLYEHLSKNAIERYRAFFKKEFMIDQLVKYYKDILI